MALPKEIKELILHELVRTNRVSDSVLRALLYDGVKTLDLRWCAKILGSSWGAVAGVCGSLTTLNLSGCKRMLGENMAVLARATANSLVNLVLDGCAWHILDEHVVPFAEHCVSLRHVNLSRCVKIGDGSVGAFRNLEELLLVDCVAVGDQGLEKMALRNPGLMVLDLFNCGRVTDVGVRAVGKGCPLLRCFTIGRCRLVTDSSLVDMAVACRTMRDLNILWCREVSDAAVSAFSQHSTALRSLGLSGCDKVSDAGILSVAKNCSRLQHLNVSWCGNVTIESLRKVRIQCRSILSIIYYKSTAHSQSIHEEAEARRRAHEAARAQAQAQLSAANP